MTDRRGFSLVEMVLVLVLAGLVGAGAMSMFSAQNRLNAAMTALGESQESARSAVQLAATELRSASGGSVVIARADSLVIRMPIVIGIICGRASGVSKAVYLPMHGRVIDLATDVDGYAFRSQFGDWATGYAVFPSDGFHVGSRQACIDAGSGTSGAEGDYATLRVGGDIGSIVMMYREISYFFATSSLDPSRRAFYRARADEVVELAQGFSSDTRFEYQVAGGTWTTGLSDFRHLRAIRVLAEVVASGSAGRDATFSLVREIQLRNAR